MECVDHQALVWNLGDFIELRFGVYLDTIMGFKNNFEKSIMRQQETSQLTKLSIEELDKVFLVYGDGPPSSDLEECKKCEIHRRTQAEFKKHNSPGGVNYDFAIENCLSDIFNHWKSVKKKMGFSNVNDEIIFPIMLYLRQLRNRVQHDLYPDRIVTEDAITTGKTQTSYPFPIFEQGQPIRLSEDDIKALVFEVRAQLAANLVPYINEFLQTQAPSKH